MRVNTILIGLVAMIIILGMSLYSMIDTKKYSTQNNSKGNEVTNSKQEYKPTSDNSELETNEDEYLNVDSKIAEDTINGAIGTREIPNEEAMTKTEAEDNEISTTVEFGDEKELSKTETASNEASSKNEKINNEETSEPKDIVNNKIESQSIDTRNIHNNINGVKKIKYISNKSVTRDNSNSNINKVEAAKPKLKIDVNEYLLSLPCVSYKLQSGETLSDIARKYESKCNLNSTIKMIKTINKFKNPDDLEQNTLIKIPEDTIINGTMYKVVPGDTWFKVAEKYYSNYDVDSVMNLIVYINNLPNNDLPLDELVFLPKL